MKYIVSGTLRPGSRTFQLAEIVQQIYSDSNDEAEIIDLKTLQLNLLDGRQYGGVELPTPTAEAVHKVNTADGLIIISPEYNGSVPGALKHFIDHWKFPDSFESRPVCFIGLGGIFGGLRPIEHLQQIFSYRNAYMFPNRVFLMNAPKILVDGKIQDPNIEKLLRTQAEGFIKYVRALQNEKLDANSLLRARS